MKKLHLPRVIWQPPHANSLPSLGSGFWQWHTIIFISLQFGMTATPTQKSAQIKNNNKNMFLKI